MATDTLSAVQTDYSKTAKILHWLVAGAIVLQFVLAKLAENSESKFQELVLLANHKSVGITILVIALVRIGWRFMTPPPAPLPMPPWQRIASVISHSALYALIILMPLTGWLMSSASNISVSWFNLFQLPDFIGANEKLAELFEDTHETMAKLLFVLAALHIAAALKHAVISKDGALRRISSPVALALFLLVIAAGLFALVPASRADDTLPRWDINYSDSEIRFEATQAGATFQGRWTEWEADIAYNSANPDAGKFDVTVRVAGVRTGDSERDETLLDADFFAGQNYPVVRYVADRFSKESDGVFLADGTIEVKGKRIAAPLRFSVEVNGDDRLLVGTTRLDRLELGIGSGEWEDTTWIGQFVDVTVRVSATVAD